MLRYPRRKAQSASRLLAGAASLVLAAPLFATPIAAGSTAVTQPNIVVIMADDLDTGVWETALARGYLPQVQARMIGKGTTFTNTFAALPLCCPSRVTYLTGQYPHNHGVIRNGGPDGGFENFAGDGNALATWLQDAGYRTGLIGKYLNGYKSENGRFYVPPGWDNWQALPRFAQFDYELFDNDTIRRFGFEPGDYQTDVLAGLAQQFIRRTDPRPFFLTVTPTTPHYEGETDDDGALTVRPAPRHAETPDITPIPPEASRAYNEADLRDKPGWMRDLEMVDKQNMRKGYNSKIAAIRAFDDLVGKVFQTLQETAALDRTLVVLTSDNGFLYGTHRLKGKVVLYDESIRLPMVIVAPGQTAPRTTDEWAVNTDWAATVVDYAGAKPGRVLDGRSLRPVIEGAAGVVSRRTALIELPRDNRAGRYPPYLALRSKDPALTLDAAQRRVLVYAQILDEFNGSVVDEELYDLQDDPDQAASLHGSTAADRVQQKANLAGRLAKLKNCSGSTCRALED